jgi:large subunit ribosomal protein L30
MAKKLKVKQVRSIIGSQGKKHKKVMRSLGFTRNYGTLYKDDSPQIRGMLHKVRHLVEWEEIDEREIPAAEKPSKGYTVVKAGGGKSAGKTGRKAAAKEPDGDET